MFRNNGLRLPPRIGEVSMSQFVFANSIDLLKFISKAWKLPEKIPCALHSIHSCPPVEKYSTLRMYLCATVSSSGQTIYASDSKSHSNASSWGEPGLIVPPDT